jgi:hypothetical protein
METNSYQRLILSEKKRLKEFGYFFALGMVILSALSLWRGWAWPVRAAAMTVGLGSFTLALVYYQFLKVPYLIVSSIGKFFGKVLVVILFTIVFYGLFTPIAFILRLSGKDVIKNNSLEPKWIDIPSEQNNPKQIEKLF